MASVTKPVKIPQPTPGSPLEMTLSSSPNGTIYGTTPGGSRIRYQRNELIHIRTSPLIHAAASNMHIPHIPGITLPPAQPEPVPINAEWRSIAENNDASKPNEDEMFSMDNDNENSNNSNNNSNSNNNNN